MGGTSWPVSLPDVFVGSLAVASGDLTPAQLRNRRRVVPVLRDVYRPTSVPLTHPLACRAAGLVVAGSARLTGPSLATALGVPMAGPTDPVTMVTLGCWAPTLHGVVVRRALAGPLGDGEWAGTPAVSGERMAFDCAAGEAPETAVARIDALAHAGRVDLDAFRTWLTRRHDHHVVGVRAAAELADARAESPPESVVRVRLLALGLEVVPQLAVRTEQGFAGRVDLAIERLRLAIEYDGRWHRDTAQFAADRERLNRLTAAGWTVLHVTAEILRRPGALESMVLGEVARLSARR